MENLIEVLNLEKQYKDFKLDKVSFNVCKGSIMGFIGENGAGKTTTMKAMLGVIKKDSGSVKLFGREWGENEAEYKNDIGVVLDSCHFYDTLTMPNIDKIMEHIYKNWSSTDFYGYLKRFNISKDKKVSELSSGMKTKLSIAVALSHRPRLLMLDEPTGSLDPVVRNEILDLFLEFIQDEEHAIMFSSHITGDLEKICDYVTFIKNGSIVFSEEKNLIHENFGMLHCTSEEYARLDKSVVAGGRRSSFSYEILAKDFAGVRMRYPSISAEKATLDDIMLYYGKKDL